MKTPFLLSFAFFLFISSAEAQLSFGIKSSSVKASFTHRQDDAAKMGGMGITFQLSNKFNKFLEIGIEPGFVQRGTTERFGEVYPYYCFCCFGDCVFPDEGYEPIFDSNAEMLKSSYLQMPVMVKLHVPSKKGIVDLYAKVGGGPSWLASGTYYTQTYNEETFQYDPESKVIEFNKEHPFNRWELGVYGGLGLGIKLGSGMVAVEAERYYGLRDVTDYASYRNRTMSYSLGYLINL